MLQRGYAEGSGSIAGLSSQGNRPAVAMQYLGSTGFRVAHENTCCVLVVQTNHAFLVGATHISKEQKPSQRRGPGRNFADAAMDISTVRA
ncbi:MAG: hypothetical protein GY759_09520 [Chloroflexi bacterium]|nr:hypothetical protein [Chloroflexota bacterium]